MNRSVVKVRLRSQVRVNHFAYRSGSIYESSQVRSTTKCTSGMTGELLQTSLSSLFCKVIQEASNLSRLAGPIQALEDNEGTSLWRWASHAVIGS